MLTRHSNGALPAGRLSATATAARGKGVGVVAVRDGGALPAAAAGRARQRERLLLRQFRLCARLGRGCGQFVEGKL